MQIIFFFNFFFHEKGKLMDVGVFVGVVFFVLLVVVLVSFLLKPDSKPKRVLSVNNTPSFLRTDQKKLRRFYTKGLEFAYSGMLDSGRFEESSVVAELNCESKAKSYASTNELIHEKDTTSKNVLCLSLETTLEELFSLARIWLENSRQDFGLHLKYGPVIVLQKLPDMWEMKGFFINKDKTFVKRLVPKDPGKQWGFWTTGELMRLYG
jgi:hypothetical protein